MRSGPKIGASKFVDKITEIGCARRACVNPAEATAEKPVLRK